MTDSLLLTSQCRRSGKESRSVFSPGLLSHLFLFCFLAATSASSSEALRPLAHYKPIEGWVGDVHPLYWGNEWHVYYLEVPNEPLRYGLFRLHSEEAASNDLIHWDKRPVRSNDPHQPWWLIANVIRGGTFYTYYNGHLGIDLSTSQDFKTWEPYEGNPVIPYDSVDVKRLRDPSLFWNERDEEYWMTFTVQKKDYPHYFYSGAFYRSASKDLIHWSTPELLYNPGAIGEPECPEMFQLDGRYYLVGSWPTSRSGKGRYRIADKPGGPWRRATTDSIDGTDLIVPNSASDGERRLAFGWIPTYSGKQDFGRPEWAGHLAFPREIWAASDGALYTKPPKELDSLRGPLLFPREYIRYEKMIGERWSIHPSSLSVPKGGDYGEVWIAGEYSRFEMKTTITLSEDCPNAGFLFRLGDREFPGYEVAVDLRHQQLILRHHLERQKRLAFQTIQIEPNIPMEFRVFVDGSVIECFLDNRFSLAGRAYTECASNRLGFYADNGGFQVSGLGIYELKEVYTEPEPPPLNLFPEPDPRRKGGYSLLCSKPFSAAYTPFDPVLNFADSFTIECWLKPTKRTGNFKRNLIVKGDLEFGYHYGLNLLADNSLEFYFHSPSGFVGLSSAAGLFEREEEWYHVAAVLDTENGELRLYKNGARIVSATQIAQRLDSSNFGALRLGYAAGFHGNRDAYLGLIDEVRLWSLARTDAEIQRYFHCPLPHHAREGLVVYWDFDHPVLDEQEREPRNFCLNRITEHSALRVLCYDGARFWKENCFPTED